MKKLAGRYLCVKPVLTVLIATSLLWLSGSCDDPEAVTNKTPACSIMSPRSSDVIFRGEIIDILVEAGDPDGDVMQVIFKIDDILFGEDYSYPYECHWNTAGAITGRHTIQATATDNKNKASSQIIDILIAESGGSVPETGTVRDYDGNIYKTVKIGSQWWMAENLRTTHYSDGEVIPLIADNPAWKNLDFSDKAYCYYDDSVIRSDQYGALYTWAAAMKGAESSELTPSYVQGICPCGWHIPSDGEWILLEMELGMSYEEAWLPGWRGTNEGAKMKSEEGWDSSGNGTNTSGFSALPAGLRSNYGLFSDLGRATHFWSSTEYINNSSYAFNRLLDYEHSGVGWFHASHYYGYPKNFGFSVRCVKD